MQELPDNKDNDKSNDKGKHGKGIVAITRKVERARRRMKGKFSRDAFLARKHERNPAYSQKENIDGQPKKADGIGTESNEMSPSPDQETHPGAIAVVLHERNSSSIVSERDCDIDDERLYAMNDGVVETTVEAELVDERREHLLEDEVTQLRIKISHAVPVIDVQSLDPSATIPHGSDGQNLRGTDRRRKRQVRVLSTALFAVLIIVLVVVLLVALDNGDSEPFVIDNSTVVSIISGYSELSLFRGYIESTGLIAQLESGKIGNLTILAPTNRAFEEYMLSSESMVYAEPRGVVHLRKILQKHILFGHVSFDNVTDNADFNTLSGESVTASATTCNVSQSVSDDCSLMVSWTPAIDIPFANTEREIIAENGNVVHIIDGLLRPSFYDLTLLDVMRELNLTKSLFWIKKVDILEQVIQSSNDFTVFMPNNEADDKISPENRNAMLNDYEFLKDVIDSHCTLWYWPIELLRKSKISTVDSFMGETLYIEYDQDGGVSIRISNGMKAKVILPDQLAKSGILHVIDTTLIPNSLT